MSPSRCSPVSNYEAEAQQWAEELLGAPVRLAPLLGGANNHLFRCFGPAGDLVIKRYRDQNFGAEVSRRQAEVAFLNHAAVYAPGFVPRLLAVHEHSDMIAMSVVEGDPYQEGTTVTESDVQSAIDFYRKLNRDRDAVIRYPVAAREGYRSISDHLLHVEQRVSALSVGHLPAEIRRSADVAIDEVRRRFEASRSAILQAVAAGEVTDELPPDYLQLSPGDFGFHNAIRVEGKPVFIDFEYAGLDDPAKTLADFFLQPKISVDSSFFKRAVLSIAIALPADALKARSRVLGRLLSVKWLAIILAPLEDARYASFRARHGAGASAELSRRLNLVSRQTLY